MARLVPLDLSERFDTGRGDTAGWHAAVAEKLTSLPGGEHACWGIPFRFGPAAEGPAFLALAAAEVAIPVGDRASHVVFAHFADMSGDPCLGEVLAEYALVYADGAEHRQPIRRRFEVQHPCPAWGRLAFAARVHHSERPVDPRGPTGAGAWGQAQTAVGSRDPLGWSGAYWLYALENPHPEKPIDRLLLCPTGRGRLGIGAITLFEGEEHPLRHRRLDAFRVSLAEEATPGEAEIGLDLGVLGRVYAVPAFVPESWLAGQPQGWGEEAPQPGPQREAIVELASTADATLRVQGRDVPLGPAYKDGASRSADGQVRVELLSPRRAWTHVEVVDAATGRPTPCRVHFRAPDGRYLPPYGHRHEVNDHWFEDYGGDLKLGSTQYAYVDGRFQIELPVGEVFVEVAKGFEYRPVRRSVAVEPGRPLQLTLERPADLRQRGWVTADTHVHFISPQTAWLEAQGEGINLVNLLASQWGDLFTNVGDLTGALSGVSRDDTLVWVGTENRQHLLGHMSLLGGKGDPVYPMCASGPSESYLGDPTWMAMGEWAEECRKREGLVVLPHFPNPYCEAAADIVLGKVDAAEIRMFSPGMDADNITEWYRYLNCGYRLPAVGGTDKMSAGMPVGGVRTYAHLGDAEFSFESWAAAVRAGRTFTTSGPLLELRVEGKVPGDQIALPAGGGTLSVEASAESMQPFHALQIVVNGAVAHEERYDAGTRGARVQVPLRLDGPSWVAARCTSQLRVWHCWPIHVAAHTSPVYVVAGREGIFRPSDASYLLTLIEGGICWLDTLATRASAERHAAVRRVFTDAHAALHARVHAHGQPHPR